MSHLPADKGVSWQDMKMQTLFGRLSLIRHVAGLFSVFEGHQNAFIQGHRKSESH